MLGIGYHSHSHHVFSENVVHHGRVDSFVCIRFCLAPLGVGHLDSPLFVPRFSSDPESRAGTRADAQSKEQQTSKGEAWHQPGMTIRPLPTDVHQASAAQAELTVLEVELECGVSCASEVGSALCLHSATSCVPEGYPPAGLDNSIGLGQA